MDRHDAGVCDMDCGGGDADYACGGYYSATVYTYTDEVQYEPEAISGAMYLGCYKDSVNDRAMTLAETSDVTSAEVYSMINLMMCSSLIILSFVASTIKYTPPQPFQCCTTVYIWTRISL